MILFAGSSAYICSSSRSESLRIRKIRFKRPLPRLPLYFLSPFSCISPASPYWYPSINEQRTNYSNLLCVTFLQGRRHISLALYFPTIYIQQNTPSRSRTGPSFADYTVRIHQFVSCMKYCRWKDLKVLTVSQQGAQIVIFLMSETLRSEES